MNLEQAYKKMATLRWLRIQFFEENSRKREEGEPQTLPQDPKLQEQYETIKHIIEKYSDELASYPEIFPLLRIYMVDVCGSNSEAEEDDMRSVIENGDFESFIKRCSSLADIVQNTVKDWGFHITDRGGGCCSWHIGVPCNQGKANKLCGLLHITFREFIQSGVLTIYRHNWGYQLPKLYSDNDVEKYVKENMFDKSLYNKIIENHKFLLSKAI